MPLAGEYFKEVTRNDDHTFVETFGCPVCGTQKPWANNVNPVFIVNTIARSRRLRCKNCDHRWTTCEMTRDQITALIRNNEKATGNRTVKPLVWIYDYDDKSWCATSPTGIFQIEVRKKSKMGG